MANAKAQDPKRKLSKKTKDKIARLPVKKQKYVAGVLRGKSKRRSALDADYAPSVAKNAKAKIETPDVSDALCAALDELIPIEKAARRIAEGIDAEKVELAKFEGAITAQAGFVDFEQRRKYLELWAKLKGARGISPGAEVEVSPGGKVTVVMDF